MQLFNLLNAINPFRMIFKLIIRRKAAWAIFKAILVTAPPDIMEIFGWFGMWAWALFLITLGPLGLPIETVQPTVRLLPVLNSILPLWVWAIIFFYTGLAQLYWRINGRWSGRQGMSIVTIILWGLMLVLSILSSYPPAVTVLFACGVAGAVWATFAIARTRQEFYDEADDAT